MASGGPKGGHLKGGHLKVGFCTEICTRHMDFALNFALDTSVLSALSKASRRHRALKNTILRCPGLRCGGLGLPHG